MLPKIENNGIMDYEKHIYNSYSKESRPWLTDSLRLGPSTKLRRTLGHASVGPLLRNNILDNVVLV